MASISPIGRTGRAFLYSMLMAVMALALMACSSGDDNGSTTTTTSGTPDASANGGIEACAPTAANAAKDLSGAGATFPNPLYTKWIAEYQKVCGARINYNSVGSGAGITQITAKTVDYGASDGIMTDAQEQAAAAAGGAILHIPMTLAPVAVVYNLPGVNSGQLKLDGPTLADIFLGNIKKWDDAKIKALNSGVNLPSTDIIVAHRSDGSGTTFIFTNYLSKVSPEWAEKVKFATTVNWPTGVGGAGNDGVAGAVKQGIGGIGYVELAYAKQTRLAVAQQKNKSGNYITPSLESATASAAGVTIQADAKVLITDSTNAQAYPITGFTWVLAYVNAPDAAKGKTLAYYLWWSIHDAQKLNAALDYAALSPDAVKVAEAQIKSLMCGGAPCISSN
jgi:phosphate transport system substrate-binding protein